MRATRFGPGMIGWGNAIEANAVIYGKRHFHFDKLLIPINVADFPWKKFPKGTTVCDVGGGVGNISMQLAKSYPSLHLILQDLPHQLKVAKEKVWPERCPEAISEHRIEFIPVDFFQESPKRNCDIYYVGFRIILRQKLPF
jgi:ubiquinone/menaquinone biosynthesis C-methylase UbiE